MAMTGVIVAATQVSSSYQVKFRRQESLESID